MDIKQKKAVIMMATYNGEKYLKQQLESILNQTYTDWDLYVSDDGSSDNTVKLLESYMYKDDRIKKILHNNKYHGAFNNFFNVMKYVKTSTDVNYDYYFYCDQDDIWVNTKMETEINILSKKATPCLCYSNLNFISEDGIDLQIKMSDYTNLDLSKNPYNIFFSYRYIWGTTIAHNRSLWDFVYIDNYTGKYNISHDNYLGKTAVLVGEVEYIKDPLVMYRRTGRNVSGTPGRYGKFGVIKRLVTKLPKIINQHAAVYWDNLYLLDELKVKNDFCDDLRTLIMNGGFDALKIIKKYNIKTSDSFISNLSIKMVLFLGLYKHTKTFKRDIEFQPMGK